MKTGLAAFIVIIVFGGVVLSNSSPVLKTSPAIETYIRPTENNAVWQAILSDGFGSNSTPLPTIAIPTREFVPPTLRVNEGTTSTPFHAIEINPNLDPITEPATPTPVQPTSTVMGEGIDIQVEYITKLPTDWQPPPLIPPISHDPLGRDHYWLTRPIDSNANNIGLGYYSYGSDGPEFDNPYRVHHGIDIPNPVGEAVRAAGSGTVVWTADGRQDDALMFQNSPSYGNVIMIQHDFGYRGKAIYTLYAHLSASLVQIGQNVKAGQVIGQVGDSGRVTGPHLHFEVRMGEDRYRATYNPVLWTVPHVGTGVIAGTVLDSFDILVQDAEVTIRNQSNGLIQSITTTYIQAGSSFDVNPDPVWQENFVVSDIPTGRYDVIAIIDGSRVVRQVNVIEGTTTFVELKLEVAQQNEEDDA